VQRQAASQHLPYGMIKEIMRFRTKIYLKYLEDIPNIKQISNYIDEVTQMKKLLKQWIPSFLIALVISLIVRTYVVEAMVVPSGSMLPTIKIHDRVVVEKLMPLTGLNHGDIIVFYPPVPIEGAKRLVKRLVGLPGDTIEIKEGYLYRNNERIIESYIQEQMNYHYGPVLVPENKYFFLGDNRNGSNDSHMWEIPFADKSDLIGKVILNLPTHYLY